MTKTNNEYSWDLDLIYPSFPLWEEDYKVLDSKLKEFEKYKNNVKDNLYESLNSYYELDRLLSKLYLYAKLNYDLDCLNDEYNKYFNIIQSKITDFSSKTSFLELEILALSNEELNNLYVSDERLEEYKFVIENIHNEKEHYLSLKEEELLSLTSNLRNAGEAIFDKLNDADVKFENVLNKELTHGTYHSLMKENDQDTRKSAFTKYHEYYKDHSNSLGECLITNVKNEIFKSKIRKFPSAIEMHLNPDKVPLSLYNNLITSVNNNIHLFNRYLNIKKRSLKLNEIHMYDLYAPYLNPKKNTYYYVEAKDIVLNSIKVMGDKYYNEAKNLLDNNLVSVYPSKGKTSGAYSSGTYDTKPYILMNYDNNLSSVDTLAHELGHSMHSYYSRNNNKHQYSDYSIFLAEIASNTHELLLFDYLLNTSNDKDLKMIVLDKILDSFKGSIFRQTQFAEFEQLIYNVEEQDGSLTSKRLTDIYYELNNKYYGDVVVNDDLIRYESLRIPHFYSSFYVYKYAIGLSVAYVFANRIINKEENAIEDYIKFISAGSKKYPLDVLRDAGIDFNEKNIVDDALKIFEKYLDKYEDLERE